ncbi:hybrid signal transduction histidine kinase M [Tanacetum coccineum]
MVCNMLLLKEPSFNYQTDASTTFKSSSSSPTILMATSDPDNKGKPQNLPQLCNHFKKGTCRFGDRCKFIHDHRNRTGLNPTSCTNNNSYTRTTVTPSVAAWGPNEPTYSRPDHQSTPGRPAHPQNTQASLLSSIHCNNPAQSMFKGQPNSMCMQPPTTAGYLPGPTASVSGPTAT